MPINGKPTYYEFFGLENFDTNHERIKKAYRSMALKWHPDRCEDKVNAERMMKQVNEVWRVLKSEKEKYDNYLRRKIDGRRQEQNPFGGADAFTSSTTWRTDDDDAFSFAEMFRKVQEAQRTQGGKEMRRQTIMENIKSAMKSMSLDEVEQLENFIMFLKRGG